MEFHLTLAELSGCTIQVTTLNHLFDLLYLKYRANILFVTPMDTVDSEHSLLYECISQGDVDQARAVLGRHISNVRDHAVISIKNINREKTSTSI